MTKSEEIERAADIILDGFTWSETKQGDSYWHEVRKNLLHIADYLKQEVDEPIEIDINDNKKRIFAILDKLFSGNAKVEGFKSKNEKQLIFLVNIEDD